MFAGDAVVSRFKQGRSFSNITQGIVGKVQLPTNHWTGDIHSLLAVGHSPLSFLPHGSHPRAGSDFASIITPSKRKNKREQENRSQSFVT